MFAWNFQSGHFWNGKFQTLHNLLEQNRFQDALNYALELARPACAYKVNFKKYETKWSEQFQVIDKLIENAELQNALSKLERNKLQMLLDFATQWNTNSKSSQVRKKWKNSPIWKWQKKWSKSMLSLEYHFLSCETFILLNDFEISRRARKCCSTFCSSCLRKKSSNFRMREVSSRHSFPTQNGRNELNRRELQFSFQTFGTTESSSQRDSASGIRPQKHEHLVEFC